MVLPPFPFPSPSYLVSRLFLRPSLLYSEITPRERTMPQTQTLLDWSPLEAAQNRLRYRYLGHHCHHPPRLYIRSQQHHRCCHLPYSRHHEHQYSDICSFSFRPSYSRVSEAPRQSVPLRPDAVRAAVLELADPQRPTRSQTRNCGYQKISVQRKPNRLPLMPLPPMQQSPLPTEQSLQDVRDVITSSVLPGTTLTSIALLPNKGLRRVYEVQLSDATRALIVIPPHPMSRLLRSEQTMTRTEAMVIRWLREAVQLSASYDLPLSAPRTSSHTSSASSVQSKQEAGLSEKVHIASGTEEYNPASCIGDINLLNFIPAPFPLSSFSQVPAGRQGPGSSFSTPFSVFVPPSGVPISALAIPLTPEERMAVDYQTGKLVRKLSRLAPISGKFGPALAVLAPSAKYDSARGDDGTAGMCTWSVAFHSILESILRDGEDVAVALAYPTIRKHFQRLSHILDTVVTPCLVVVDIADDTNLLVERSSTVGEDTYTASRPTATRRGSMDTTTETSTKQAGKGTGRDSSPPMSRGSFADITVTGIRDWSHCLFGDPLFASVFCDQPSEPFLLGFGVAEAEAESAQWHRDPWMSVESKENRTARLLLYQCYHAVVDIVKGFYRPGRDQTIHELAARKRLTEILAKLDTVREDPRRGLQHRRPSGGVSPAKKLKSDHAGHP